VQVIETASAILVGNELLSGKVRDENLHALAQTLRQLGIRLKRSVIVEDEVQILADEVRTLKAQTDLVITSGGVGPTHDDVTIEAIARAFSVPTHEDPQLRDLLHRVYKERLTQSHMLMARVPQGAQLMCSDDVSWPTVTLDNVWVFPGVPQLFRMKLLTLRDHVRGPVTFHTRSVYTLQDEGDLKPTLDAVVQQHPEVEVGSYPIWFEPSYKTKLTLDGVDSAAVERALRQLLDALPPGEPQKLV